MTSCVLPLPPPSLLLLLFAVAWAGPFGAEPTTPPEESAPFTIPVSVVPSAAVEVHAVPAATLLPAAEGQYCTVDGEVFHNGARLPINQGDDPCRACYCQGGEPVCTRVHCYRRPDCAPRHVAGRCCPKYDNCPPAPEDRVPEPRFKDASTQTDSEVGSTLAVDVSTQEVVATTPTESADTTPTTVEVTSITSTTYTEVSSSEPEGLSTVGGVFDAIGTTGISGSGEDLTSALPPGIDLHALHDHLPFLSPGDANGPNT